LLLFYLGLALMCSVPLLVVLFLTALTFHLDRRYLHHVVRIFQEKPLFIVPRGQPLGGAERVCFPTDDGLTLTGCYLKAEGPRRGVILFGLEFGSDCWSCRSYCDHLAEAGFDVFAFESRNQGTSDALPGYEPLQWVTDYEVHDTEAALAYLKGRPDADPRGVGFFGISKGGGAGLFAACADPYVRCCVTDGAFGTFSTLIPYMRRWLRIYSNRPFVQSLLPHWYYGIFGRRGLRLIEAERRCHFPHLEPVLRRLTPRPLLMIHGAADTYIRLSMARALFDAAREPKELWLVEGAKHNQALQVANGEYRRRVLAFFEEHLAGNEPAPAVKRGGGAFRVTAS
jgi:dipeptidyl aminopeptidase/acylaminoacyl peptidase